MVFAFVFGSFSLHFLNRTGRNGFRQGLRSFFGYCVSYISASFNDQEIQRF